MSLYIYYSRSFGSVYLLTTRELELGSAQSLHHVLLVLGLGTHGHDHLTDVHAGHGALGFTKSTTHSSLEPARHKTRGLQDEPDCAQCSRATGQSASHLSAPAQDNILLMRMTWKGCRRMRMWKPSLPQVFTMYLLAQIRAASRATGVEAQHA